MKTTLVIGDSWAAGHEGDTKQVAGWPYYLEIPDILRQGVGGSTAAEWAGDKNGRLTRAIQAKTDAVVISLMGNDARIAMSDGKVTPTEFFTALRNMRTVVAAVQKPVTIVMLYADPWGGKDQKAANAVAMLNGAIQMACMDIRVEFADTSEWLTPEHFVNGDIHPTKAGHQVIADNMREMLQ